MDTNPFVSFVIPTIGRETLANRTLPSLLAQTDGDWEIVLVFDGQRGIDIEIPGDPRVRVCITEQTNSAGLTRNFGLEVCRGEWIAFLDDDDSVTPDYVEKLKQEIADFEYEFLQDHWRALQNELDVVLFRMDDPILGIIPRPGDDRIYHSNAGISFAVRAWWLKPDEEIGWEGMKFIREDPSKPGIGGNEDVTLLKELENRHAEILVSKHVTYNVRH